MATKRPYPPPVVKHCDYTRGFLQCPSCEGEDLHQRTVQVFFRKEEDGAGICMTTDRYGSETLLVESKEMPGRRDSLRITFWCESCSWGTGASDDGPPDRFFVLEIKQSKGVTFFEWLPPSDKE